MRIGILGGTFDPPHYGHLQLAKSALKELSLDRIYFVPARRSPMKSSPQSSLPRARISMLKLFIKRIPKFRISTFEINRQSPSYTVDTVQYFRKRYPESDLFFLMGDDSFRTFRKWKKRKKIMEECTLVVGRRYSFARTNFPESKEILKRTRWLRSKMLEISSTDIRSRVRHGQSVYKQIPRLVTRLIRKNRLYG